MIEFSQILMGLCVCVCVYMCVCWADLGIYRDLPILMRRNGPWDSRGPSMGFLGPECLGVATLLPPHPLTAWGAALNPSDPDLAGAYITASGHCFGPAPEWTGALCS